MASLTTNEKQVLEKLFQMGGGYALDFSDRTMGGFFRDDLSIDIYNKKFNYASGSKANHMRGFWIASDDKTVGQSMLKLIEYIKTKIIINSLNKSDFPDERIKVGEEIGERLLGKKLDVNEAKAEATFKNGSITITLQKEIFDHVQKLLNDGYYFNAVEEAYKVVRQKLVTITGSERATDAFSDINIT